LHLAVDAGGRPRPGAGPLLLVECHVALSA
jgi:hypothetical protein